MSSPNTPFPLFDPTHVDPLASPELITHFCHELNNISSSNEHTLKPKIPMTPLFATVGKKSTLNAKSPVFIPSTNVTPPAKPTLTPGAPKYIVTRPAFVDNRRFSYIDNSVPSIRPRQIPSGQASNAFQTYPEISGQLPNTTSHRPIPSNTDRKCPPAPINLSLNRASVFPPTAPRAMVERGVETEEQFYRPSKEQQAKLRQSYRIDAPLTPVYIYQGLQAQSIQSSQLARYTPVASTPAWQAAYNASVHSSSLGLPQKFIHYSPATQSYHDGNGPSYAFTSPHTPVRLAPAPSFDHGISPEPYPIGSSIRLIPSLARTEPTMSTIQFQPHSLTGPVRRIRSERIDPKFKDVIITSAGMWHNIQCIIEEVNTYGEVREYEGEAFKEGNYNLGDHIAQMTKEQAKDFWTCKYVEIVVDIGAIDPTTKYGGDVSAGTIEDNRRGDAGSSSKKIELESSDNLKKMTRKEEVAEYPLLPWAKTNNGGDSGSSSSKVEPESLAENFKKIIEKGKAADFRLFPGSKTPNGEGSSKTALVKKTSGPEDLFGLIASLGPYFTSYVGNLYITLKFPRKDAQEPARFSKIEPSYENGWIPASKYGAIDFNSTPAFRYIRYLVAMLQSCRSLKRFDITFVTEANTPRPLTINQIHHLLPFFDFDAFTAWRAFWKAEYMSRSEELVNWPIAYLYSEWSKICQQRDMEYAAVQQAVFVRPSVFKALSVTTFNKLNQRHFR